MLMPTRCDWFALHAGRQRGVVQLGRTLVYLINFALSYSTWHSREWCFLFIHCLSGMHLVCDR